MLEIVPKKDPLWQFGWIRIVIFFVAGVTHAFHSMMADRAG